ncbi:hypothetical protein KI387_033336, partial [Taxus chinensis]
MESRRCEKGESFKFSKLASELSMATIGRDNARVYGNGVLTGANSIPIGSQRVGSCRFSFFPPLSSSEICGLVQNFGLGVVLKTLVTMMGVEAFEILVAKIVREVSPFKPSKFFVLSDSVPKDPSQEVLSNQKIPDMSSIFEVEEIKFGGIDFKILSQTLNVDLSSSKKFEDHGELLRKVIICNFVRAKFSKRRILDWVFLFWGSKINPKVRFLAKGFFQVLFPSIKALDKIYKDGP